MVTRGPSITWLPMVTKVSSITVSPVLAYTWSPRVMRLPQLTYRGGSIPAALSHGAQQLPQQGQHLPGLGGAWRG